MIPSQKTTTAVFAGALTTILIWVLEATTAVTVPGPVAAAIVTVTATGLSYLVRETRPAPSTLDALEDAP